MTREAEHGVRAWEGLAVAVAPTRGLVGPEAAAMFVAALDAMQRLDRVPFSPQAAHVRSVMAYIASAQAGSGHPDVRKATDPARSELQGGAADWMTTLEAALEMGCSQRHANRLANDHQLGPSRMVKKKRMVRRSEVAAYLAERRTG